ncbi:ABC transporter permease subunit [candidate division KSB3 bacterium]|uniref:ABC transporter permease subunit n=1 Tax=candidate division KSB3 bacterium TaxID=2044937 RepID=A0A9D5JX82_9BACT|nr:ABC transporter permease subunit [candidate division KSB3 bacterium]MBD3325775.1 ABC transporter permease subunit [candidate division KSB3 bacterium]
MPQLTESSGMSMNRFQRWKVEHEAFLKELRDTYRFWKRSPLSVIGTLIILGLIAVAMIAPLLAPYDPLAQELQTARLAPPTPEHPFGTDQLGRDIFSRVIWGSRISLRIAIIVALISGPTGLILGIISGYFGGKIDEVLMRVTDMFLAFPKLILAMAVASALGPNLNNAILAIAVASWPAYARLARGETLVIREHDFIEAIRALGANNVRILLRHVLPVCLPTVIVRVSLDMGGIILTAAGLGFIGFGAQPPTPEWGIMVSDGRSFLHEQWWVSTFPGIAILIVVLGFNLLGDGIRDILDPRQKRKM